MTDGTGQQWYADPTEILTFLEHDLQGEVFNHKTGEWDLKEGQAILNEDGRKQVISLLRGYVNKFTMVSDYEDADIRRELEDCHKELAMLFFRNWGQFDIKNHSESCLINKIMILVQSALRCAKNGRFGNKVLTPEEVKRKVESVTIPVGSLASKGGG